MDGIAIPYGDVPTETIERYGLSRLIHERGGERELRFLRRLNRPVLPVWHQGRLRIVPWGCRTRLLPVCGLTWLRSVEEGAWSKCSAECVEIPAVLGLENGVWYYIRRGVRGIIAETPQVVAAYVIVEPASYYYRIMTRKEHMPVLIEEGPTSRKLMEAPHDTSE